jgi:hypothetical protein
MSAFSLHSRGFRSGLAALCMASALGFGAGQARAQARTEVALAEALYRQARELSAAGNYAEACPKFAESYRLDPATGTLLNLAACHEAEGKTATAWIEYSDALAAARRDNRAVRVKYAQERMAAIEPKLSRLTLLVPPELDEPELELWLDGTPVGRAARGVATPVDPGRHVVEAKAPGKKPLRMEVEVLPNADQKTVMITQLESLPPSAQPQPMTPVSEPANAPAPIRPLPVRDEVMTRPTPLSVYIAGGVTLGLAAAAGVTGGLYLHERSEDESKRESDRNAAQEHYDSARVLGVANAALWVGAVGGAVLTTYLYVTRPERPLPSARVLPFVSAEAAGLCATGEF